MWGCTGTPPFYASTSVVTSSLASARATRQPGAGGGGSAMECQQRSVVSGEQHSALGQYLEPCPLPGARNIRHSDVAAMKGVYDKKIANALKALSGGKGAFRNAMCLLGTIKKKKALVGFWTVRTAREGATEVDNLLGQLAVCCDRTAKDILRIRELSLVPSSVIQ